MKAAAAHGSPTVKAIIPRTFDGPMGGDEKGRPRRRLHECTALGGSSGKWAEGRGFEETGKACCRASEGGGHARARRHRAAPGRWGSVVAVALLALASIGGVRAAPATSEECAAMVSVEETCYITDDAFSSALFPAFFSSELDPCPTDIDYFSLYKDLYDSFSLVTIELVTSDACLTDWLYSDETGHCYFKSFNTEKAASQIEATDICAAMDSWVISVESEEENDFLVHNLLWVGFFGETYTGLIKDTPEGEWEWPVEAVGGDGVYSCLTDFSDWLDGPEVGCNSTYDGGSEEMSCMEIYPYEPKNWKPFSCLVGKHYVCEMEPLDVGSSSVPSPTSLSSSSSSPFLGSAAPTATTSFNGATASSVASASESTPAPSVMMQTPQPSSSMETPAPSAAVETTSPPTLAVEASLAPSPGGSSAAQPSPVPGPSLAPSMAPSGAPIVTVTTDPFPTPTPTPTPSRPVMISPAGGDTTTATDMPVAESPTSLVTPAPSVHMAFHGTNRLDIIKREDWSTATYSIFLENGGAVIAVATDVPGPSSGSEVDVYHVTSGCYRLEVDAGSSPLALTWEVSGGEPIGEDDSMHGTGLDGGLFSVGGGLCSITSCEAACLADTFYGSASTLSSETTGNTKSLCDSYKALLTDGACDSVCAGTRTTDEIVLLQQDCVRAHCNPDTQCNVAGGYEAVDVENQLYISTLLLVTYSVGGSSNGGVFGRAWEPIANFKVAMASWLGVDTSGVTVTSINGVNVEDQGAEDSTSSRRRRLSTESDSSSSYTEYVRYTTRVEPDDSSDDGVVDIQAIALGFEADKALEDEVEDHVPEWSSRKVLGIKAPIVGHTVLVSGAGGIEDDDGVVGDSVDGSGSTPWYETEAFTIGVIVVAVAFCCAGVVACCRRRGREDQAELDDKNALSARPNVVPVSHSSREGSGGYESSKSRRKGSKSSRVDTSSSEVLERGGESGLGAKGSKDKSRRDTSESETALLGRKASAVSASEGSPKTAGGNVKGVSGLKARQGAGAVEKQEQVTGKASPTLASPHGELATAAETVSTADGKAGDSDWPTDPDSPGFKKLQEQQLEQLRELQLQAQAWAAQADGGQGFDVDRSAGSGVGAAASEANVPVSEPSAPAATDSLSSDNAGSHVEEASKSSKNASPSEPGVGAEGSRYAGLHQGGSQGQARGNHHRSRSSESEITVGGISGYNPGYGDNDSDCGSRMLEPAGLEGSRMGASDRSLGENSPGPFSAHFGGGHGSRPDELDFNDGRRESEVGKYDSDSGTNYYESSIDGHGRSLERQGDSRRSMDDVRYDERFTSVGSPYTPTSADFRRHFQSGVSGDLDETVSQATMSDLAYSSSGDFRSNLNSSSRSLLDD